MSPAHTILIVDDTLANLGLLYDALAAAGYHVRVADGGQSALQSVAYQTPDLILLDVMMPDLDGFAVCDLLKSDPHSRDIPVIFMTALTDQDDELRGFAAGAVDYVTKPIRIETMLARVRTHLALRDAQLLLQRQNADLDAYARTVAHDLKNPLSGIVITANLLLRLGSRSSAEEKQQYLLIIQHAANNCVEAVDALLELARERQLDGVLEPVAMGGAVQRALNQLRSQIAERQALISQPQKWPTVMGKETLLAEIWLNYVSNALKYGGEPPQIELGCAEQANGQYRFWVRDNGPGLTRAAQSRLFNEFVRLHPERAEGTGLGLAIVQRIVSRFGGEVGVESEPGYGSTFFFTLVPAPNA